MFIYVDLRMMSICSIEVFCAIGLRGFARHSLLKQNGLRLPLIDCHHGT